MKMNLIISDSRGKGLEPFITKYTNTLVYVSIHSGAGLYDSVLRAKSDIIRLRPQRIYIISGVNNLTLMDRKTRKIEIRDRDINRATENFLEELRNIQHLISTLPLDCPEIVVAPITGLSIATYNNEPNTSSTDQDILNATVIRINMKVTEFNEERNQTTPWMASYIHRYYRKKYHFTYGKLSQDGCHLTDEARDFWGYKLAIAMDTNK